MRFLHLIGVVCLVAVWSRCGSQSKAFSYSYDFTQGQQGWLGGDSEFAVAMAMEVNFLAGMQASPIPPHQMALHIFGNNVSDDLFVYATKQLTGLLPNRAYSVRVEATLISDTGNVGGSSQIIKLGASTVEPSSIIVMENAAPYYRMNVDIGGSSTSGKNAVNSGDLSGTGGPNPELELLTFKTPRSVVVQSDPNGNLWLLVGVDSAFEILTEVYFTEITATLREH
jgi:hypothetical protein